MRGQLKFGLLMFLLIALGNCKQDKLDPSVIINVENDFYVDLFEEINNDERLFKIRIRSVDYQDCLNAVIEHDFYFDDSENRFVLSLYDISDPETCIPGEAPATLDLPLESLEIMSYKFQINLKDVVFNSGTLTVSEDYYFLLMNTQDGFKVQHNLLYKIPQNTIWGYVGYSAEADKQQAENITKDLKDIAGATNFSESHADGWYGYFNISQDHSLTLTDQPDSGFSNPFLFLYDPSREQDIIDFVETKCLAHPGFDIHVFNDKGEEIACP